MAVEKPAMDKGAASCSGEIFDNPFRVGQPKGLGARLVRIIRPWGLLSIHGHSRRTLVDF